MTWTLDVKSPPLLRLPRHIRRRVYLYLDVARFDRRLYTYYLDGRKESRILVSR
jgi:hypothetical protein